MNKSQFYKVLRTTRHLMKWGVNTKGHIRAIDMNGIHYCPVTAVEKALYGKTVSINNYLDTTVTQDFYHDWDFDTISEVVNAADTPENSHERKLLLKGLGLAK